MTTVRTHLKHIYSKLGVSSQIELIQFVYKMHI
ncbi:helix-turn-helix transcriptional regulator [Desulfitobacterium sp. PCE1]|nr:LuxR C-terminal-related transcriptional regulator [Desulfitobacterium sp. PCE1]